MVALDLTPPPRRDEARYLLAALLPRWRDAGRVAVVRVKALETDGPESMSALLSPFAPVPLQHDDDPDT